MSVLIEDMEKPKSCYAVIDGEYEYCPFVNTDDDCVLLLEKGICEAAWVDQYSKCPLVEVQEPCEDAVSRADVEIEIANLLKRVFVEYKDIAKKVTARLPSVTPNPEPCEDAVIDKLTMLPSAQHEIIHCRECKYAHLTYGGDCKYCDKWLDDDGFNLTLYLDGDFYCGFAEMKEDE